MRFLIMAISLALAACGGTTDSGYPYYCYSDGPIASNLVLARNSAIVGEGGGSIAVDATFDYRTRSGAKIKFVDFRVETAAGQEALSSTVDTKLKGRGSFTFSVPIGTQAAEVFVVRVRVFDECLEKSNWLEATFEVLAPAALAGKTGYATAMADNRIYFIGGQDDSGQASDQLLQFDPVTEQLLGKAPLPAARAFAAAAAVNGVVYVFGGQAYGAEYASTFAYDTAADTWTAVAPMSLPNAGAVATIVDDLIYIDSGAGPNRYDPLLDVWTDVSDLQP